jgi:hypothetical protein
VRSGAVALAADRPTLARAASIEGLAGALWLSWGPPDPPAWLAAVGLGLAVVGLVVAVAGLAAGHRVRGEVTAMRTEPVRRGYLRVVAAEFAALVGVGVVLGLVVGSDWAAVWVAAVVGLHFLPLARVLPGLALPAVGTAITLVAGAALAVGLVTDVAPTAVTGPGTGLLLVGAGAACLAAAVRRHG